MFYGMAPKAKTNCSSSPVCALFVLDVIPSGWLAVNLSDGCCVCLEYTLKCGWLAIPNIGQMKADS